MKLDRPAPVSDTRREDVARAIDPEAFADWSGAHDPRAAGEQVQRVLTAHAAAVRVLTVVDEAEIAARALDEAAAEFAARLPDGTPNGRAYNSHQVAQMLHERAARLRGATR